MVATAFWSLPRVRPSRSDRTASGHGASALMVFRSSRSRSSRYKKADAGVARAESMERLAEAATAVDRATLPKRGDRQAKAGIETQRCQNAKPKRKLR